MNNKKVAKDLPKKVHLESQNFHRRNLLHEQVPLDETHLVAVRGLILLRCFNKVHQRGELS